MLSASTNHLNRHPSITFALKHRQRLSRGERLRFNDEQKKKKRRRRRKKRNVVVVVVVDDDDDALAATSAT